MENRLPQESGVTTKLWRVEPVMETISLVEVSGNTKCNTPTLEVGGVIVRYFKTKLEAVDHLIQYLESELSRLKWVLDSHKKLKLQISQEGNSEKME